MSADRDSSSCVISRCKVQSWNRYRWLTIASTPRSQFQSPLLRLPGELRNLIYFHLFITEAFKLERHGFNTQNFPYINRHRHREPTSHRLALLSVCRQTYAEAALLPFTLSTIEITNIETLEELPFRLTTAQCSAIRSLKLTTPLYGNANIVPLFVSKSRKRGAWLVDYLPGVRTVHIQIVRDYSNLRPRCPSGVSFLQRVRLKQRRDQTEKWLTGGGGAGVEVTFGGYGMCGNEIARGNRDWWENSCSCC
jgi:hypothetical protein